MRFGSRFGQRLFLLFYQTTVVWTYDVQPLRSLFILLRFNLYQFSSINLPPSLDTEEKPVWACECKDSPVCQDVLSRLLSTLVYALSFYVAEIPAFGLLFFFHSLPVASHRCFEFRTRCSRLYETLTNLATDPSLVRKSHEALRNLSPHEIGVILVAESVGNREVLREAKYDSKLAVFSHCLSVFPRRIKNKKPSPMLKKRYIPLFHGARTISDNSSLTSEIKHLTHAVRANGYC